MRMRRRMLSLFCILFLQTVTYAQDVLIQTLLTQQAYSQVHVSSAEQFLKVIRHSNIEYAHVILDSDIDLAEYPFTDSVIGVFSGIFDGNGHCIQNLTLQAETDVCTGLIGKLAPDGIVVNLGITNARVLGNHSPAGILIGKNNGFVQNCFSTGTIQGCYIGGLIGINADAMVDAYSQATVIPTGDAIAVGGLAAMQEELGLITRCYSAAQLDCSLLTEMPSSSARFHGLVNIAPRASDKHIVDSLWDRERYMAMCPTMAVPDDLWGYTTAKLHDPNTYRQARWDLPGSEDGLLETWTFLNSHSYPILGRFHRPRHLLTGQGTADAPYLIGSAEDLAAINDYSPTANYRLTQDIDLSGMTWSYPIISNFAGFFNGNGYRIRNLHIVGTRGTELGLFRKVRLEALIQHLGIEDAQLSDSDVETGALAGSNFGSIVGCYATGTVQGDWFVGGLVGAHSGFMLNCFADSDTQGQQSVGALVGYHPIGHIIYSYSPKQQKLVGFTEEGTLIDSYSALDDTQIDFSHWDFTGSTDGLHDIWLMVRGNRGQPEQPRLRFFEDRSGLELPGSGTPDDPYRISELTQLGAMLYHNPGVNYALTDSLDLSGIQWSTPPIPYFWGNFDGNGHLIQHLTFAAPEFPLPGFIGELSFEGHVKDLGFADADVSGNLAGLLAAVNLGQINNCYAEGLINASSDYSGGLVGTNVGDILNCYGQVDFSYKSINGGLVGLQLLGTITNSYSKGLSLPLVGYSEEGQVVNSFSAFENPEADFSTWDFWENTTDGLSDIWTTVERPLTLPRFTTVERSLTLTRFTPLFTELVQGSGTPGDPYLITHAADLGRVKYCNLGGHFRLTQDISLAGTTWSTSVIPYFLGTLDGNGHTIRDLKIQGSAPTVLGLIGELGESGHVKNLGVVDANISGSEVDSAALIGKSFGTIQNCHVTGTVTGLWHVGGLAGSSSGQIIDCNSLCQVTGERAVGQIVGYLNFGLVQNCVGTEKLIGEDDGGLVF